VPGEYFYPNEGQARREEHDPLEFWRATVRTDSRRNGRLGESDRAGVEIEGLASSKFAQRSHPQGVAKARLRL